MRVLFRLPTAIRPLQLSPPGLVQRQAIRPLSSAQPLRLKEGKPQDPEEVEDAKQNQHNSTKKREELESQSESAVKADQDGSSIKEMQRETAKDKQKEHQEGK